MSERVRVLVIGPNIDGTDAGECYSAFRWVEALSRQADVTLLTATRPGRKPLEEQLPRVEVVAWPEPPFLSRRLERFNAMAKPYWPVFAGKARAWIREAQAGGRRFDVAHQMLPQGARYPCPARGTGIPYLIGPLGGGLETPPGFAAEVGVGGLAGLLRRLDGFRLARDPWLRGSYAEASIILGVAPYMRDRLAGIPIRRFENVLERANDGLAPETARDFEAGRLKMLHVGRGVRTKALRDVVRAMALLRDLPGVTLTSAGDGPDLVACRREARELGVGDRVTFLGKIPRAEVERLYETHDVFAFPSFREPMGGVLFEAMRWGLPVIAVDYGGPGVIVDHASGLCLPVSSPDALARDVADAARRLALDVELRRRLGAGARARAASFGSWDDKAAGLIALYREAMATA